MFVLQVAEVGADGRRSQIFLALSVAEQFRGHLSAFSDYYASLGKLRIVSVTAEINGPIS